MIGIRTGYFGQSPAVRPASGGGASSASVRAYTTGEGGTITLPVARQAGDLLLLFTNDATGSPVTPSGWTLVQSSGPFAIYSKVSTGSEPAPAFPIASWLFPTWGCYAIRDISTGVEASSIASFASGASRAAPSVASGGTGRILATCGAQSNNGNGATGTLTMPAGQTTSANLVNGDGSASGLRVGAETVGAGDTGTRTVTNSASGGTLLLAAANVLVA